MLESVFMDDAGHARKKAPRMRKAQLVASGLMGGYRIVKEIGKGIFGLVQIPLDKQNRRYVMKKMSTNKNMQEIKALQVLVGLQGAIQVNDVLPEWKFVYVVMELGKNDFSSYTKLHRRDRNWHVKARDIFKLFRRVLERAHDRSYSQIDIKHQKKRSLN